MKLSFLIFTPHIENRLHLIGASMPKDWIDKNAALTIQDQCPNAHPQFRPVMWCLARLVIEFSVEARKVNKGEFKGDPHYRFTKEQTRKILRHMRGKVTLSIDDLNELTRSARERLRSDVADLLRIATIIGDFHFFEEWGRCIATVARLGWDSQQAIAKFDDLDKPVLQLTNSRKLGVSPKKASHSLQIQNALFYYRHIHKHSPSIEQLSAFIFEHSSRWSLGARKKHEVERRVKQEVGQGNIILQ